jgi:hypothetical protein
VLFLGVFVLRFVFVFVFVFCVFFEIIFNIIHNYNYNYKSKSKGSLGFVVRCFAVLHVACCVLLCCSGLGTESSTQVLPACAYVC